MSPQETIEQLEDLIADRSSFFSGDKTNDEIYEKDIQALRRAITALEHLVRTGNYNEVIL